MYKKLSIISHTVNISAEYLRKLSAYAYWCGGHKRGYWILKGIKYKSIKGVGYACLEDCVRKWGLRKQ